MGPDGQSIPPMPGQPPAGPIPPTFMPMIEDMKVHLDIHGEAIKALEFDSLPGPNKEMMIQHFMETKMAMEMMAAGQPVQPGAPGAGPGAGPGASPGGPPEPRGPGLSSHGHPTGGTQHAGQGIQPIGASKGAPPAGPKPSTPVARPN
jgi:hypothetical protein